MDTMNNSISEALKSKVDSITNITYSDLKNLRDNSQLTPGSLYRITDYQCTTTQENTQSAGHQFDIVLLALSNNKLAEEGWAMMNESNVYDVTFSDGVTKKCYMIDHVGDYTSCSLVNVTTLLGEYDVYCSGRIDVINKTIIFKVEDEIYSDILETEGLTYNYFQNSNLSAWKVWYCLDNDKSRFAWADDSVDEDIPATITSNDVVYTRAAYKDDETKEYPYGWISKSFSLRYTQSATPNVGDVVSNSHDDPGRNPPKVQSYTPAYESTNLPNGRGVIYRLIDEWNNDCPYDFKNIQFIRPMTDGDYNPEGEDTWVYTLSTGFEDSSIPLPNGEGGFQINSTHNYIGQNQDRTLNNIVAITCNDCDFKACSIITLSYCGGLILSACGGDDSVFSFESNAIYINNKKVLTEE